MNEITLPKSPNARNALAELTALQQRFREGLDRLSTQFGDQSSLVKTSWFRDGGRHGGGWRWGNADAGVLNRGSLNISSVHYDDLPEKRLSSATALSCIVHPQAPIAPSLHTHISWTELREGSSGGWRLMADLNPSTLVKSDKELFISKIDGALNSLSADWRAHAKAQGDRYFKIPALKRHRGVAHYYVEQWSTGRLSDDLALAVNFGECVIDVYLEILEGALKGRQMKSRGDRPQTA